MMAQQKNSADGKGKRILGSVVTPDQRSGGKISGGNYPFDLQCKLLEAETLPEVLGTASSMLARVPGTVGAWIFQRDAGGQLLLVQSWKASHSTGTPPSSEQLGKLIHQRWIAAHRLGQSSTEFARPFSPTDRSDLLVVPMMIGEELVGALAVHRREGDTYPYLPEDIVTLATIAGLTAQQLQLTLLRERAGDQADQQETRQEIVNEVNRYVAHELHDGVVQDMAYMRLRLEMLERVAENEPEKVAQEARQIHDHFNDAIDRLRTMINDLRKPRQQTRGITGRLRDIAGQMADQSISERDPEIELDLSEISGVRLEPEVERAVVGIVREAMQNIRKHADASSVHVEVQRRDNMLDVEVRDDGRGISEPAAPGTQRLHFGIQQMKELAEDMGGSLSIEGAGDRGTRVLASIPLVPAEKRS
jgi:signal transduction histidine kinase